MFTVGILALQGNFAIHESAFKHAGFRTRLLRKPEQMDGIDLLVLPGGESTALKRLMNITGFQKAISDYFHRKMPIFATCAGLILCAKYIAGEEQSYFSFLDAEVARNGWGRQVDSFEAIDDTNEHRLVFIRAPRILKVGEGVNILLSYRGEPVLVQQENVVAATFHPELSQEGFHKFLAFFKKEGNLFFQSDSDGLVLESGKTDGMHPITGFLH